MTWQQEYTLIQRLLEMRRSGAIRALIYANEGRYRIGARSYSLAQLQLLVRGKRARQREGQWPGIPRERTEPELRKSWTRYWEVRASEARETRGNPFLNIREERAS